MKDQPRVLMIGTDIQSRGGISSVIGMYQQAGLLDRILFMPSYTDGSMLKKLFFYTAFLIRFIWTLLTQPSIRLVHIHSASYGSFLRKSLVMIFSRLLGRKTVVHIHGAEFVVFYNKASKAVKKIIRTLLKRSDAIIALSHQWKRDLYQISKNPNIRVIYNPTVMQKPIREESNGKKAPVRFLFMGRLGKRKGVYDIIESAKNIRSENVEIQLYGDGEVDFVRQMINARALDEKVTVCGWISGDQKDATFRSANVLILPSYNEGLPISVLEAMSYGMPVLATDVGGISEAVEDGVTGFLIQPGECDKLASRIDALASSPELREQMGRLGYEMAARKFALPVIIKQLEGLYDELLAD
jgi:glycosyltransferase involved in cell wall biosynthesis